MKRFGGLEAKIRDIDNCRAAIREALRTKSWKRGASEILADVDRFAALISENPFVEGRYRKKEVVDRASGKVRSLMVPTPLDLCRQHQLMRVVSPLLERSFYAHSYACRKNFGFMKCAAYCKRWVRRHASRRHYFAKIDVVRFYESIDHRVMKALFRKRIKDRFVLALLDRIVDSTGTDRGLPIGNFTSQIFANVYLTPADYHAKQALFVPFYVRYADDMLIMSRNRRELTKQAKAFVAYLKKTLRLDCHEERIRVSPLTDSRDGFIDYCGFKIFRNHTHVRKRTFLRIRRVASRLRKFVTVKKARSLTSYLGYIMRADCFLWEKRCMRPGLIRDCRNAVSHHDRLRSKIVVA